MAFPALNIKNKVICNSDPPFIKKAEFKKSSY